MKFEIIIFFILLSTLKTYGQTTDTSYQETIRYHKIEYVIKSEYSISQEPNGSTSESRDTSEIERYDQKGRLIAFYKYDNQGNIDSATYKYKQDTIIVISNWTTDRHRIDTYSYNSNDRLIKSQTSFSQNSNDSIVYQSTTNYVFIGDSITYKISISPTKADTSITTYADSLNYRIKIEYDLNNEIFKKTISKNNRVVSIYYYGSSFSPSRIYVVTQRKKNGDIIEAKHYGLDGKYWGKDIYKYSKGLLKKYTSSTGTFYETIYSYKKFKKAGD